MCLRRRDPRGIAAEPQRLARSGADPARSVMVGDRSHDMLAACHTGAAPLGAGWGYGSEQELRDAGALHIARALHDAGLPPGVLNLVFGTPAQISDYLIPKDQVRLVAPVRVGRLE